ncbi:hypothetical protein [Allochromatium palmeri]|uniref:YbgF trimerisation domain-containing protein n=1 Tax=Allochromatium palmeri TaxID=231048 RepID=A0A6N8EEA2_9GAMM|nr:hypothetical protein [Allochromatium palmeri]MTW22563.1 hypothetical protein [Allochromatium palmeri]
MKPAGVPDVRPWLLTLSLGALLAVVSGPAPAEIASGAPPPSTQAAPAADPAAPSDPERDTLKAQLDDIQRLLSRLDDLETQLIAQAQQALDRADAAQNHDERARQERLYGEIGARIGELRATRRDIAQQLQVLEQTLDDSATTQPDR